MIRPVTRRAILYLRQSKQRDDSISLELQEESCRAYCARQGYVVAGVVIDEGVSGRIDWRKRPNFPSVMDSDAEAVVVYRWSRLSRSRRDQQALIALLEDVGKTVESAVEPIDPATAGGKLSRDVMMTIAAYESDVKSEQWKEAHARRLKRGLPKNNQIRWGYMLGGDDGVQVVHPENGPLLREMYLRYIKGAGFQNLVKELNERGVVTEPGNKWGIHSLIRAMDSGFGAGLVIEGKGADAIFHQGVHEAVITRDEFDDYQREREKRRTLPSKRKTPRWFLLGLVKCGRCGGPMLVNSYDSPKSQLVCSNYKNTRTCDGVWINRVWVENRVAFWVGAHVQELQFHAYDDTAREDEWNDAHARVDSLERDLGDLNGRLAKLAEGWASGLLDDAAYRGAQETVTVERDDAARRLRDAREEASTLRPIDVDEYEALARGTEGMTPGEWGSLLGKVLRRVEIDQQFLTMVPVTGESVQILRP